MPSLARNAVYGRFTLIFGSAFLVAVVVIALLGQFGLPDAMLGTIVGGAALVTFLVIGLNAATMQTSTFYLAGRSLPAAASGAAGAAAAVSGTLYLGLAGAYFGGGAIAAAVTLGWCFGLVVLTVAVAPYVRKSSAFGVADFLGIRYASRLVRLAAVIAVVLALAAALAASIATATSLTLMLLDIGEVTALTLVVAVVLIPAVAGGMGALTLSGIAGYIVLAVAILLPVAVVSLDEFGVPLPQFTFGLAAREADLLALASGRNLAEPFAGHFLPLLPQDGAFAVALAIAGGVAALPHLVMRSGTVRGPNRARLSSAWMLLFVVVVALAAPAYAAFSRLVLLRDVADTFMGDLPQWIFAFARSGLVRTCGVAPSSVADVATACRSFPGFDGTLHANELALGADAVALAGPSIVGLPYAFNALLIAGGLAAALAAAGAIAFAIASAIGHDFFGGVVGTRASGGRQLIVTRLALVAAVLAAAWASLAWNDEVFALAPLAISLSAGALLPAVLLGVWWKRANAAGAFAGIASGAVVTLIVAVTALYPETAAFDMIGFSRLGLDALTAGLIAAPVGAVAVVAGSLMSATPKPDQDMLVDDIRRPGGAAIVQENEGL